MAAPDMTFVLTNDDGVDAPGLQALSKAIGGQGVLVAPTGPQSGCSHRVTTHEGPIRVEPRGENVHAVHGTPADCVRVALAGLHPKATAVLSGINLGGNLGADMYVSGTVAAAREAAFLGVPGIAVSQYVVPRRTLDWDRASRLTAQVLNDLLQRDDHAGAFWNVNLPHVESDAPDPPVVFCAPCKQPLPVDFRIEGDDYHYEGKYSERARDPGADVDLCFSGSITVSRVTL